MPDIGNLKGPKFGDIDWRDDISEKELENLFKSFGKEYTSTSTMTEEMEDGTQHTTTTTTTQSADGTKTQTTTTWTANVGGFGSGIPLHERIKRAEAKAKAKMAEMEAKKNAAKPKKPSFLNFGRNNTSNENMDISAMIQQMQGGNSKKNWDGPTIKGLDDDSLNEFVDEWMEYEQKEFEKKLANEPVPDGLIDKTRHKIRQKAERVLFNFTHKIKGIMAQGMLRKLKEKEDKQNERFKK